MQSFTRVGIVLRPSTPELQPLFFKIKEIFESHGIEVLLDNISGGMIGVLGQRFDIMCRECDFLATIGGDGTLIATVRRSFGYNLPVMGIHAGKLGFLADFAPDEVDEFLHRLKDEDYRIDERAMLEAHIHDKNGEKTVAAFNDIVLTRPSISKMIRFETFVHDKAFNTYFGDGVIVSTPTGSTAYNLSAGGPVLFPLTQVFVLTPICPHSLTQRPVVLPGHFPIEIRTPDQFALAIVDGQDMYEIGEGDVVRIQLATEPAKLLHRREFNYFEVLKTKLNWGEG